MDEEVVFFLVLQNSSGDEVLQHGESVNWLVKRNHVTSLEDSQELEVLVGLEVTGSYSVDLPVSVWSDSVG